jgi:iron complex outermembrane receptor protein
MQSRSPAGRLARIAYIAIAALPTRALAQNASTEGESDPSPIIVTGTRQPFLADPAATEEGVDAERLSETTTLVNAEDSLRYLPSLLVRKRHIGDTQAPLATRTSGVGASARSLIYVDGILLSALIGNNNSSASPRWAMVSPEEIERVDVLYGPFSAAYPGNSIGAVVNIATRMPERPEGSLKAATSIQSFSQYGTSGAFPAYQLSGTAGGKVGPLSFLVSANHVVSRGHPLAYVTVARPTAGSIAGTLVTGAFPDVNRAGSPIYVIGAGGLEDQRQDNLKLKLGLDLSPALRLTYQLGLFLNDTDADARSYLSGDAYAGQLNIDGRLVNVPATAFSNNVYRLDERHWMHGLTAEIALGGFEWRASGSFYDFAKDVQRIPSGALPAARNGGPGSIVKLDGTGWKTLDLSAARGGLSFGLHWDEVRLRNERYATADWRHGDRGVLLQAAAGRTRTKAIWAQQQLSLAPSLTLTVGARYEWWRADRGFNFSLAPALSVVQPELERNGLSPKASLRWQPADEWSVTLSAGQAYRYPTVQELYQAISTGPSIAVPNPDLRPERARSEELAIERRDARGRLRVSLFNESIKDALLSQTAPLLPGSTALFNYVQNIPAVRTRGLEVAFERAGVLAPQLEVAGSFTLAHPKIVRDPLFPAAEGKDIPQVPRRRATLLLTWRESEAAALTLAARHASRSFGTIDNSDVVAHTYQGFEGYLVADARASFRIGRSWRVAFGVENIGNDKYYIFHPFPQRTFTAEVGLHW